MKVNWKIRKKRGNFRPRLTYTISLDAYEKKLAIHAVQVESHIPMIPGSHLSYCLPGEHERSMSWKPDRYHVLQVPYFKDGYIDGFIRLPFKESGQYPEVVSSFEKLREEYEKKVCMVYAHPPLEQTGSLDTTDDTRSRIASTVTANRLLSMITKSKFDAY
ncbi:hypothetical protein [Desulfobacter vibrioformis]|uniref:hypothetical protein n=1 Tax=Desulfobacter vibrioformis TaxID=34031 RepID=UPI00068C443B|nr:hypothetical protein [Desulfobacter vibrioformis]